MIPRRHETRKRRLRRTCRDRFRFRMLQARRRNNPAASVAMQLMALFAVLLFPAPSPTIVPAPTPYAPLPMSARHAQRVEMARRLGVPRRYLDIVLNHGAVPYRVLFDHIHRGGISRLDAMSVLRQRAPEACRDWLVHVEKEELWSDLLRCHVRTGLEEDTDARLLKSTLAWLEDSKTRTSAPGPADAGLVLKP